MGPFLDQLSFKNPIKKLTVHVIVCICVCLLAYREPAEELLYRLRELEEDSFLKTVHSLGLGPIDFAEHVRKNIRVSASADLKLSYVCVCLCLLSMFGVFGVWVLMCVACLVCG